MLKLQKKLVLLIVIINNLIFLQIWSIARMSLFKLLKMERNIKFKKLKRNIIELIFLQLEFLKV